MFAFPIFSWVVHILGWSFVRPTSAGSAHPFPHCWHALRLCFIKAVWLFVDVPQLMTCTSRVWHSSCVMAPSKLKLNPKHVISCFALSCLSVRVHETELVAQPFYWLDDLRPKIRLLEWVCHIPHVCIAASSLCLHVAQFTAVGAWYFLFKPCMFTQLAAWWL